LNIQIQYIEYQIWREIYSSCTVSNVCDFQCCSTL